MPTLSIRNLMMGDERKQEKTFSDLLAIHFDKVVKTKVRKIFSELVEKPLQ